MLWGMDRPKASHPPQTGPTAGVSKVAQTVSGVLDTGLQEISAFGCGCAQHKPVI